MIRPVSYADIFNHPSFSALTEEYGAECSTLGRPNPQPDLYDLLERSGGFQAFGVYEDEALVGYASVLIYVLPHFGINREYLHHKKFSALWARFDGEDRALCKAIRVRRVYLYHPCRE